MAYGILLDEITSLESKPENIVVNLAYNEVATVKNLHIAFDGDDYWWEDDSDSPTMTLGNSTVGAAIKTILYWSEWSESDAGHLYNINIATPEVPTQSFSDAVHMVIDGEILFEATLENEVPVEVTGYEANSALMYDIYIDDKLCKRFAYSVLGGTPSYSTYDTTGDLYIAFVPSTGEITLYGNEGDTCSVKIVKKSRPESIMVFANKSGDAINVDAAFSDILTAAKEGYTFQLAIDGQVAGSTRYSEIGTLQASLDTSTYAASFDSTVTWRGSSITWTVNLTNMSISGAVGGSQ